MPLQIIRNDITKVKADAIVNTANPNPLVGGGTDRAIYYAAGVERLLKEREAIGKIKPGDAKVTSAFQLDAKYIIHTVGPIWIDGEHKECDVLRSCYESAMVRAVENQCESIAFPLISSGVYGFPKDKALNVAISAISSFLMKEELLVYLVVFDDESFELSGNVFEGVEAFIDEHYVIEKKAQEYGTYRDCIERKEITYQRSKVLHSPKLFDSIVEPDVCDFSDECEMPEEYDEAWNDDDTEKSNSQRSKKGIKRKVPKTYTPVSAPTNAQKSAPTRSLDDVMSQLGESFQQRLLRLIDERALTDVEVYKKANIDRKLFSKIRCNEDYKPKKKTAIALAIALGLNLDETKDLLSRAELALSPSNKFDLIIEYFIMNEIYDVYTINVALFKHGQSMLGE